MVAAGALTSDELGGRAGRLAVALWTLSPGVVLYVATSADAVFAAVLGLAALAAHRGLVRRSWGWSVAGGALLWAGSMLTYPAVLLVVFLLVRAIGRLRREPGSVDAAALATLLAAASWGFSRGEVERIFQFLVPLMLVPVTRQLLAWRVRLPVVGALLVAQTLAVQVLFATRW